MNPLEKFFTEDPTWYEKIGAITDKIRDAISALTGNELKVVLAGSDHCIYFTKTHVADIKRVVEVDISDGSARYTDS